MKRAISYLMTALLLLLISAPISAASKPDIIHYTAQFLDRVLHVTLQWQSANPVTLVRVSAGQQSKEIKVDEYDNRRVPGGYTGEVTVNVPVDPTLYQKNVPYVLQLQDELKLKSELVTGNAPLPVVAGYDGYGRGHGRQHDDRWGQDALKDKPKSEGGAGSIIDKLAELKDKYDLPPSITEIKVNLVGPENVTFTLKANDDKQLREINFKVFDANGNMVQTQQVTGLGRVWEGTSPVFKLPGGNYRVTAQAIDSAGNTSKEQAATFFIKGVAPAVPEHPPITHPPVESTPAPQPVVTEPPHPPAAVPTVPPASVPVQPEVTPVQPVPPTAPSPPVTTPPAPPAVTPVTPVPIPPEVTPVQPVPTQPVPPAVTPVTPVPVPPVTTEPPKTYPNGPVDAKPICPTGQTLCADKCVNLLNDPKNCGSCGTICPQGKICQNGSCSTPDAGSTKTLQPPSDPVIYSNGNIAGVQNGPRNPTSFTITAPHKVTWIYTYHYFNNGKLPGTIALRHSDGTTYGPFKTEGAVGQGNVPNAYWWVKPNVEIKAGSYTVIDSDNATWSHNSGSNYAGFVELRGIKNSSGQAPVTLLPGMEDNTDRLGMDYRSFDLPVADPKLCKDVCDAETQCKAYTFVRPGVQGVQARCWLKSAVPNPTKSQCCVSGVKPQTQSTSGMQLLSPPSDPVIYSNGNIAAVQNGPRNPTSFTITAPHKVTWIYTYHYFNNGKLPGTIALRHSDGTTYGPFKTEGAVGQGNVPNAYWWVKPNVEIKAGSYTVIDSDNATWSHNSGSNYAGFVELRGIKGAENVTNKTLQPPSDPVIYSNGNIAGVQNGPRNPTSFTITTPHKVTWIYTYHYFNNGKLPGTIALRHSDGTTYGPFKTEGAVGQGNVPNAYWWVKPNVEIKAGSYTVVDSDNATWSHNSGSNYAGFVELRGIKNTVPQFTGLISAVWNTSEGVMTLTVSGNRVSGTYTQDNGKIEATINGNLLEGFWSENSSGQRCKTDRNGNYHWGKIRFTFSGDSFKGAWGYCDEEPQRSWTGTRKQ